MFTKKQKIEFIRNKISSDRAWALKALTRIYEAQTEEEKTSASTIESNGIGFNGLDSSFLTSVTEFYLRTGFVSDSQLSFIFKKIGKYASQIYRISDEGKLESIMQKALS